MDYATIFNAFEPYVLCLMLMYGGLTQMDVISYMCKSAPKNAVYNNAAHQRGFVITVLALGRIAQNLYY